MLKTFFNIYSVLIEIKGPKTLLEVYGSIDNVKIVTIAPEVDVTGDVTKMLTDAGIIVGLGHSMGTLKDGEKAVAQGARLITHLFNAMLPVRNVYS